MSKPVIVRRRVQRDFTILPNDVVRDPRLSWKALGLLVYVLSLPDDFRLHLKYLTHQKPTGRDGTRAGLKELEIAGYLTIRHERSAGRFAQVIWDITDSPDGGIPTTKSPYSENPNTVNPNASLPNSGKPALPSTSSQQELIEQSTTTTESAFSMSSIEGDDNDVVGSDFTWPLVLTEKLRESAKKILQDCPVVHRQNVLYEIGGLADRGGVRHPLGLLSKLVERAKQDQFVPAAALSYQQTINSLPRRSQVIVDGEQKSQRQISPGTREAARKHLAELRRHLEGNE